MIPKECKRLAEVDFPIAVVSKHAAKEKSIRYGHPSTLHLWWARRPLAACRSMLMALLLPDPVDKRCPVEFNKEARRLLSRVTGHIDATDEDLRRRLLQFIGDFANWDLSADRTYLEIARGLVKAAHPEEMPLVVDPFAGGASIPLEALRIGCETFASDLNPVACLIQKVMLEDIPRHGPALAEELRRVGAEIKKQAEKELAEFYPRDLDGAKPIAYLWARTVRCESPNCGAEIPLIRSFWLSKKDSRKQALRYKIVRSKKESPRIELEVFQPTTDEDVPLRLINRAKATCPCCNVTLPPDRVRAQLAAQRGGADVIYSQNGHRIGGAILLAAVTQRPGEAGRHYRSPSDLDYDAVRRAQMRLASDLSDSRQTDGNRLSAIAAEPTPVGGGSGAGRAFSIQKYGMMQWRDLFTARQLLTLTILLRIIAKTQGTEAALDIAALALSRLTDIYNHLCIWEPVKTQVRHLFANQAIPVRWDFPEASAVAEQAGDYITTLNTMARVIDRNMSSLHTGTVQIADACESPLPDHSAGVWFTDPPYYDAIPYSDLSDFFFVWLKQALRDHPFLRDPFDPDNQLTPKIREIVQDETKTFKGRAKDRVFFEGAMASAFAEGRRVLKDDGIGCVVFAHKTTEGWEALLSGMIRGGWVITGSWPIATELAHRPRARDSAALATSVHLVCRPRSENAGVGDWGQVLRELPSRVGDWIERLQVEGVRGADLVFACIGPALEIFSRYSKVETAEGREVNLAEFLEKVWEVVGRTALEHVLGTAEAVARNGAAGAVEEDARLTALFLWTLQSTNVEAANNGDDDNDEANDSDDDDEDGGSAKPTKGYTLIYDVVRRFAQPLGIHLEDWDARIIETKKGVVRLLSVSERAKQLFGEDGATAVADRIESDVRAARSAQMLLFPETEAPPKVRGRARKPSAAGQVSDESLRTRREATTLDRVHAAMLLQASGRANALRALLKAEMDRGPDFLRLSNALSALYPRDSEEKRLLDAMLLAVPR